MGVGSVPESSPLSRSSSRSTETIVPPIVGTPKLDYPPRDEIRMQRGDSIRVQSLPGSPVSQQQSLVGPNAGAGATSPLRGPDSVDFDSVTPVNCQADDLCDQAAAADVRCEKIALGAAAFSSLCASVSCILGVYATAGNVHVQTLLAFGFFLFSGIFATVLGTFAGKFCCKRD